MKKVGYIELKFPKKVKHQLHELVSNIVDKDMLYCSDQIEHIAGDVTPEAHFTLFFGLKSSELKSPILKDFINNTKINTINLKGLKLMPGYQNLYKVLYVNIEDSGNELKTIYNKILNKFEYDSEMIHDKFIPHVTIAYVKPGYEIPKDKLSFDLKVSKVSINLKNYNVS